MSARWHAQCRTQPRRCCNYPQAGHRKDGPNHETSCIAHARTRSSLYDAYRRRNPWIGMNDLPLQAVARTPHCPVTLRYSRFNAPVSIVAP